LKLVYFARVREAIGFDREERDLPDNVQTVCDCLSWLAALGENYATAFADTSHLRFALDQQMAAADSLLDGAKELAIFPPVTGG
jgi:molybdopterin synthase sulfur carrier subunit